MTDSTPTPPLADVIAEALYRNEAEYPGEYFKPFSELPTRTRDAFTHQARAVLEALEQAGGVEWGIRYGDGDIDGGYLHKSEAQEDIEKLRERVRLGASPAEGNEPMTLLTRRNFEHAGPWTAVE